MSEELPDAELIAITAQNIADPEERERYLLDACGDDEDLLSRVRTIMAALPKPATNDGFAATIATDADMQPIDTGSVDLTGDFDQQQVNGTLIAGRYKLIKRIGEGGMGSVWAAEQREPVVRTVALKLIKQGMDSQSVLARFDAERQALALMDHPNIARIFDGGVTESGAPYFVMELVKGEPITDFCDARRLTLEQRLELFVPVCQAIQHAHHKGIIHRDIKPSNVLVTTVDDRPVPKVIDFGVAKATGPALTGLSLDTGFSIVGTPQYMSPEQASMNNIDVDTRSDVYSLGVLLYELLAGSPPFRKDELAKAGYMEILRVIREVDPPRPSTKLSTAEGLPSLSASRGTDPKRLSLLLRNDLDWIVMRALEKDRTRRYETANAFAADINRYLHGEPVQAHPPSTVYRLGKFLRKNRGPVLAAGLVAAALIAGIVGTSIGMMEARRQTTIAAEEAKQKEMARQLEAEQRKEAEIQRANAERERGLAEQRLRAARQTISTVVNRIPNLLERVPLSGGAQNNILSQMESILSTTDGGEQTDDDFSSSRSWGLMAIETRAGQQAVQNEEFEKANGHYRRGLEIAQSVLDGTPRDRAKAMGNLAMAYALCAESAWLLDDQEEVEKLIGEAIRLRTEALSIEPAEESRGKRLSNLGAAWNRAAGFISAQASSLPMDQRMARAKEGLANCRVAIEHLEAAIEELRDAPLDQAVALRDLAVAAMNMARLAIDAKEDETAFAAFEQAKSTWGQVAAAEPERVYYQVMLADTCGSYGDYLLVQRQDPQAARVQYVDSMKLLRGLNADANLEHLKQMRITAYYRLGLAAESQGNQELVSKYFERACLLSDLHLREKTEAVRNNQDLLIDDQVQLMLEQAWAGQTQLSVRMARDLKALCHEAAAAGGKPWIADTLARVAFALAIVAEKGGLNESAKAKAQSEALETLQMAIDAGFSDLEYLEIDPDVAPLRRLEKFAEVLSGLRKEG